MIKATINGVEQVSLWQDSMYMSKSGIAGGLEVDQFPIVRENTSIHQESVFKKKGNVGDKISTQIIRFKQGFKYKEMYLKHIYIPKANTK